MTILSKLSLVIGMIYFSKCSGLQLNINNVNIATATAGKEIIIPPPKVPLIPPPVSSSSITNHHPTLLLSSNDISPPLSQPQFLPFSSSDFQHLNEDIRQNIVLTISSSLPKFDSVGHKILSANYRFIYSILHNDILSPESKKTIILDSIKLAQMGDDFGSHILQVYYNLVEKFL
tara:strand:- start:324 stop:848 length:525 start_codon:yes stop_codon:yes gene_type:complete